MNAYSDELRLLWLLLLNAGVFASAWRFARRWVGNGVTQAICDAFLIYFFVEYASVALTGAAGVFNLATMSGVALVAAAGLVILSRKAATSPSPGTPGEGWGEGLPRKRARSSLHTSSGNPHPTLSRTAGRGKHTSASSFQFESDHLGLLACTLFTFTFVFIYAWLGRLVPPMATDSIVYHLPTVVQWMQTGRLGIYPTWYWNPAASYSPATGMTFMAWLMAPAGSDLFVRFVQVPPLLFIFFLTVRFCRVMGCTRTAAGLLGIAAALSRSLFSEAIIPKDDLFITAFVAAAVLSLVQRQLQDRLGPWRAGLALGFVLASKYTVLLVCPVFLFMVDAPFRARWRWRDWGIAIGIVLAMAAPWYVRNLVLMHNPLYPVDVKFLGIHLPGLFATERDKQLRTAGGVWTMLTQTYHSLPTAVIALLLVGWIAALVAGGKSMVRDPFRRACGIGSVITLVLFLVTSPHHEVRYMFPLFVLWFADLGLALSRWSPLAWIQGLLAAIPAAISTVTSFDLSFVLNVLSFAGISLAVAGAGVGLLVAQTRVLRLKPTVLAGIGLAPLAAVCLFAYINYHSYVGIYLNSRVDVWGESQYPAQAPLWKFVEQQLPPDATIAYANTYFVYPLYDPTYRRRVGYAPVRRGLHSFLKLPKMGDRVPGDLIFDVMAADMNADPDRQTWLENLRALGATYLVVDKKEIVSNPPELTLARADPRMFQPVFEDDHGIVFAIRRDSLQ